MEDCRREEYLKGLIQNPVFKETLQYCADSTVNAVVNNKKERIDQHKIMLSVKADIDKELPFVKSDICAVLANLLDKKRYGGRMEIQAKERKCQVMLYLPVSP